MAQSLIRQTGGAGDQFLDPWVQGELFYQLHHGFSSLSKWAVAQDFQQYGMFDHQSLRSACAYMQSYLSLC